MTDHYWINDDLPLDHARVHREDCSHCSRGRKTRGRDWPTGWIGPFPDREIAFQVMEHLNRKDARGCGICKP